MWLVPALALGLIVEEGIAASVTPIGRSFITANQCVEHQAFMDGDPGAVAGALPRAYVATVDPGSGKPLIYARSARCLVTLAGVTRQVTMASFGIVINSPDGRGCASGAPGASPATSQVPPVCNWYPLLWLANDRATAQWLRSRAPAFPARYTAGLVLNQGTSDVTGGRTFHFQAPAASPGPFTMDDTGHLTGQVSVRGGYWAGTGAGAVKLAFSTDDITTGLASNGVVRAPAGSALARLMGATASAYLPAYAAIGAEFWAHGSYRKQLLGPSPSSDSFSGSCSLQGTDTFTPPANNTAQDLHLTYAARGSCSGTLDGQQLSNASVVWQSSAHSYGSCSQANTVEPGEAFMTFPNGRTIAATFDFTSLGTQVNMSFYGERSGFANGQATFATQRTPPGVITGCAGAGDREVPMDLTVRTESPLVSDRNSSPAAGHRARARFSVRARPRTAGTGRITPFSFRVTTRGRPVAGVLVRFAGHRARTGRHGRATFRMRLRRPGRWTAVATKQGFRAAHVTVRVLGQESGPE